MKKVVIGLILVAVVAFSFIWFNKENDDTSDTPIEDQISDPVDESPNRVEIFANTSGQYGVEKESTFTLKFDQAVPVEEVDQYLNVEPQFEFTLSTEDEVTYQILPKTALLSNKIYAFTYDPLDYGKAFQTIDDIKIIQSFPGKDVYDVPTRSVVELVFNIDGIENLQDYFSIEPQVQGSFDYQGNTVVFMPENLKSGTYYQVTIAPGLTIGNRTMTEAYSFGFNTGYDSQYNYNINYNIVNQRPEEETFIKVNTWRDPSEYQVTLYKTTDFEIYKGVYSKFVNNTEDLDLTDFDLVLEESSQAVVYNYDSFIQLPQLEMGRYIVKIVGQDVEQYTFLQVDPHQVYFSQATNGLFFWVMNGDSKAVQAGAKLYHDDVLLGETGNDGVFFTDFDYKTQSTLSMYVEDKGYLISGGSSYAYFYYDDFGYYSSSDYWSFMYTDRTAYLPNDTAYVYGFAKAYDGLTPEQYKLKLSRYWSDDVILEKEITLNQTGSYTEALELNDLPWGYYTLTLTTSDQVVDYREIFIVNYDKPEVYLESSIEEEVVFGGDSVHYQIKASYFNEMPYEGMGIQVEGYDFLQASGSYTTNEDGLVELVFQTDDSDEYWYPNYYEVYAYNNSVESTYLYSQAMTMVLPRKMMILSDYDIDEVNQMAKVDVSTYAIDLSQYKGDFGQNYDAIKGQALDQEVTVYITDNYYEKIFEETIYDPIHKVTYDVYRYERRSQTLPAITLDTIGGDGQFDFGIEDDHYYTLEFLTQDENGRNVRASTTVGAVIYKWFNYSERYTIPYDQSTYLVGDLVEKEVLLYNEKIENNDQDQALHLLMRDGILEYYVTDDPKLDFVFKEEHRPNMMLKTIYFDGQSMNIVPEYGSVLIGYDYQSLEGQIAATTDKDLYKPGELVTLSLDIEDSNGQAFNGEVNVSVVDEAFFALYENYFNLGDKLHQYVYSDGILNESVSNDESMDAAGAEAGEGGDESFIRQDFKDTAFFETIQVVNGKAQVTFELPDNITGWRITLNAVNKDLAYASNKIQSNVNLPFFIRPLYNTSYVTGEEVYLALKADGYEGVEGPISYTAKLLKAGSVSSETTVQAPDKGLVQLGLGQVEKGTYQFEVTGQYNAYQDGVLSDVTVEDTYVYFDHLKRSLLSESFMLQNSKAETRLRLVNQGAVDFVEQLYHGYQYDTERLEEIVARYGVYEMMNQLFDLDYQTTDLSYFQNYDGGLRFLKTSDPNIKTSALIAGTKYGVRYFDQAQLISYLRASLLLPELTKEFQAMILWGLASQEQAVLLVTDEFLKNNPWEALDKTSQLYILLALQEMKDKTRLEDLSKEFFEDLSELTPQEYLLAATLSTVLYNDPLVVDTKIDKSNDTMGLQNIYYLMHQPLDFKSGKVAIEINGEMTTYDLPGLESVAVVVPENSSFTVKSVEGDIKAFETYQVNGLDYRLHQSDEIHLEKTYNADDVHAGDLVLVTLSYEKVKDRYAVIGDIVPSGFEYAGLKNKTSDMSNLVTNQHLEFYVFSEETVGSIEYYIRAVQAGKYKAEPAYIQMFYEEELHMTEPEWLEVRP